MQENGRRLSTKCRHSVEITQPGACTRIRSHTSGLKSVIFDAHVAKNDEIIIRCPLTLTAHVEIPASYQTVDIVTG